uniref:Uncharacterized protein n=1 Tax=Octopus bimaculoides TaxID=37653 RepID=A0A0L8HYS4_OCTBM
MMMMIMMMMMMMIMMMMMMMMIHLLCPLVVKMVVVVMMMKMVVAMFMMTMAMVVMMMGQPCHTLCHAEYPPRTTLRVHVSVECSATCTLISRAGCSVDRINWNPRRRKRRSANSGGGGGCSVDRINWNPRRRKRRSANSGGGGGSGTDDDNGGAEDGYTRLQSDLAEFLQLDALPNANHSESVRLSSSGSSSTSTNLTTFGWSSFFSIAISLYTCSRGFGSRDVGLPSRFGGIRSQWRQRQQGQQQRRRAFAVMAVAENHVTGHVVSHVTIWGVRKTGKHPSLCCHAAVPTRKYGRRRMMMMTMTMMMTTTTTLMVIKVMMMMRWCRESYSCTVQWRLAASVPSTFDRHQCSRHNLIAYSSLT